MDFGSSFQQIPEIIASSTNYEIPQIAPVLYLICGILFAFMVITLLTSLVGGRGGGGDNFDPWTDE